LNIFKSRILLIIYRSKSPSGTPFSIPRTCRPEQILKNYNGQAYWLSANIYSFSKGSKIPKWLNVALGYGAEGMISANGENFTSILTPKPEKFRQFYLSLDVDLSKIKTKSHFLKTILAVFNTVKIPAPTVVYSPEHGFKLYLFYF
jgi:hypothetical protein